MTRKWLPLAPAQAPGVWANSLNMLPMRSGTYSPGNIFQQVVAAGPATPGTTLRAWCALLPDDTACGYVGTTTKLYYVSDYLSGTAFTDRSVGGGYTNTATDWSFAQYGNITFAVNRLDSVQTRDSTAGAGGSAFANATGAPPKARIVVTQSDQVLLFDLNDGAEKPDAFAACAPGDHTDWSGAGATTATRIRHRPGKITAAIAFRDHVLVFKRGSVYRLTYTGNNTFKWKVELIAIGRGAWGKHDVVNCGDVVVFRGPGGVWTYDGAGFRSIADLMGDFNVSFSPGASAAFYSQASQSVIFHTGVGHVVVYNLVSDAWGRHYDMSIVAFLANSYRMLSGEPAALVQFSGTVGTTVPEVRWIFDLSLIPCVQASVLRWGLGTAFGAVAYVTGSLDGEGNDKLFKCTRVDMVVAPAGYNVVNNAVASEAPGNTEVSLSLGYTNSPLVTLSPGVAIPSSTEQRRFDTNQTACFFMPTFTLAADSGYLEIDDYVLQLRPEGRL